MHKVVRGVFVAVALNSVSFRGSKIPKSYSPVVFPPGSRQENLQKQEVGGPCVCI